MKKKEDVSGRVRSALAALGNRLKTILTSEATALVVASAPPDDPARRRQLTENYAKLHAQVLHDLQEHWSRSLHNSNSAAYKEEASFRLACMRDAKYCGATAETRLAETRLPAAVLLKLLSPASLGPDATVGDLLKSWRLLLNDFGPDFEDAYALMRTASEATGEPAGLRRVEFTVTLDVRGPMTAESVSKYLNYAKDRLEGRFLDGEMNGEVGMTPSKETSEFLRASQNGGLREREPAAGKTRERNSVERWGSISEAYSKLWRLQDVLNATKLRLARLSTGRPLEQDLWDRLMEAVSAHFGAQIKKLEEEIEEL